MGSGAARLDAADPRKYDQDSTHRLHRSGDITSTTSDEVVEVRATRDVPARQRWTYDVRYVPPGE